MNKQETKRSIGYVIYDMVTETVWYADHCVAKWGNNIKNAYTFRLKKEAVRLIKAWGNTEYYTDRYKVRKLVYREVIDYILEE